ncbi:MAG: chemotaxis response regulator protein-glutamate methylesterase [Opitutaceae bacterium]|nr:chemotaxis response regulator protein-glutamate methylesterase [Opitutaceae bacterium]
MLNRKIRVLIVDDSAVVRKLVTEALASDPEIEVVGTAIDPYLARDKIVSLKPDVLTLDIEMPRMDGLTFLRIIMSERPMPVIIMSSLTQAGSHHALEALRLGAVDVLGKPSGSYSFGDLGPQLRERIKAAAVARIRSTARPERAMVKPAPVAASAQPTGIHSASHPAPAPVAQVPVLAGLRALAPTRRHHPRRLILLGASTGGTEALREVLTQLPGDMPPIAVVQHIPAVFSNAFAQRLDAQCNIEVREAVDGDRLVPGLALVAPGNFHLLVTWAGDCYRARVISGPQVWHQRPAVDLLFKSAVECAGSYAIAGVFTGMGKDGAEGLAKLRAKGALTFSQDEESSVVYGMPKAAWEQGGSQKQVALEDAANHLIALVDTPPPPSSLLSVSSSTSPTLSAHVPS